MPTSRPSKRVLLFHSYTHTPHLFSFNFLFHPHTLFCWFNKLVKCIFCRKKESLQFRTPSLISHPSTSHSTLLPYCRGHFSLLHIHLALFSQFQSLLSVLWTLKIASRHIHSLASDEFHSFVEFSNFSSIHNFSSLSPSSQLPFLQPAQSNKMTSKRMRIGWALKAMEEIFPSLISSPVWYTFRRWIFNFSWLVIEFLCKTERESFSLFFVVERSDTSSSSSSKISV